MILDLNQFFFSLIYRGLKESHKEDKIGVCSMFTSQIPTSVKSAIKKEYGNKFLDDSDITLWMAVKNPTPPMEPDQAPEKDNGGVDQGEEQNNGQNTETPDQNEEQSAEGQNTEDNAEEQKNDNEEEVKESTKKEDNVETQEDIELKNDMTKLIDRVLYNENEGNVALNRVVFNGKTYHFVKISSRKDD